MWLIWSQESVMWLVWSQEAVMWFGAKRMSLNKMAMLLGW